MLKRNAFALMLAAMLPAGASAQDTPTDRLMEVLPEDVATRVIAQIEAARNRELPDQALANLALEGIAKGRSAEDVLAGVEMLVDGMGRASDAIRAAGRAPEAGEVEAATAAMQMGVDGSAISELARSQPSGQSLAVPMMVLGGLAQRGLPSDEALARVSARLAAGEGAGPLLGGAPEGPGAGRPDVVGPGLAAGLAGMQLPVSGLSIPVGPQVDGVGRPGGLPVPGNRPGPGNIPGVRGPGGSPIG